MRSWTLLAVVALPALALAACGGSTESALGNGNTNGSSGQSGGPSSSTGMHHDGGAKGTPDGKAGGAEGGHLGGDAARHAEASPSHDAPSTSVDTGLPPGHDASIACPATTPTAGNACPVVGKTCSYDTTDCDCSVMKAWECHACPATAPDAGSACTATTGGMGDTNTCSYGATDCSCTDDKWACGTCPATAPTAGAVRTMRARAAAPQPPSAVMAEAAVAFRWTARRTAGATPGSATRTARRPNRRQARHAARARRACTTRPPGR